MRVTQLEMCRSLLSEMGNLNQDLSKYSSQVSSGKLLNSLKDSPSGSAELVSLAKLGSDVDQYLSNTNTGNLYLNVADSALNEVNNLVTTIYSKAGQAVSETISDDVRATLASDVRSLRDQIVTMANSEVNGRYIFAGTKVTSSPFLLQGDTVSYQGDGTVNTLTVDAGTDVQMNYSGDAVFSPIFSTINTLLTALDGNDISAIQTAMSQFAPTLSALSTVRAQIGSNMNVLENVQTRLGTQQTSLKTQTSQIEDADMAQAAVQLKQTQTALDAAMSATSSVLTQKNLFDILG
ncbi:MAG TPA: flagellar hook-associated protein FlgL [Acidobacteriota bacterium]|nr:flagellar hook-associated protein FlgL [Acidobacteriota bacterium]